MNKRYLWVVEVFTNGEWEAADCDLSRNEARKIAAEEKKWGEKARTIKYVPEQPKKRK